MTLAEMQRELDFRVLQYMDEMRPRQWDRNNFAFPLMCFVEAPLITKDMARALCRSLTDRGYAFYMRGLFNEDGETAGAGYGMTEKGAEYLKTLSEAKGGDA